VADRALVVGCMELALASRKKDNLPVRRRWQESPTVRTVRERQIICADDDHAKYIALTFTGNQVGFRAGPLRRKMFSTLVPA